MKVKFTYSLKEIHDEPIKSKRVDFSCTDCNKLLGHIQVIEEVKEENTIIYKCSCGGESFVKKTQGKVYYHSETSIKDITEENGRTLVWVN